MDEAAAGRDPGGAAVTRWDELFADLAARAAALETAERAAEIGDRTRAELAAVGLTDRLRAAVGTRLRVQVLGGLSLDGALDRVEADWLLLDEGGGREAIVAVRALRLVHGLSRATAAPGSGGAVSRRLTLRSALRGLARDRSAVRLHLLDAEVLDATVDRVGADFVDAARHAPGEPRRREAVREVVLVPIASIAAVRRQAG